MSQSQKRVIVAGPWGGPGGDSWDMGNISPSTRLTKIVLQHNPEIHSIAFGYESNGLQQWFPQKGGDEGELRRQRPTTSEIVLEPDEFITSIRGYWRDKSPNERFIYSLTFVTNVRQHGPYGREDGTLFSFVVPNGKIIGFHGRSGWYLDAIGIYVVSN